ncbi:protein kinase [bacterium]|nr:protein kinase [bacterium]
MIGQTVAQYRILEKLGEGAVGVVYRAEHVRLGTPVAIKFLRPEFVADDRQRQRFLREAKIASSLDSHYVCPVLDYGEEEEGRTYLVLRYCEGDTLKTRLEQGPLPMHRAVIFAIQIAEGLKEAHERGIVHRDVKPSNVVIATGQESNATTSRPRSGSSDTTVDVRGRFEVAKVTDFGLALLADRSRMTHLGRMVGTPAYMAPEQVRGHAVDARTDIWAIGVVLHEMLTGELPFVGDSVDAILFGIQHHDPPRLDRGEDGAPAELGWIVSKCLRKDPSDRYRSCDELLGDLRLVWRRLEHGGRRTVGTWVAESRGRMLWLGGGLLAIAAVMLVMWLQGQADRAPSLFQVTPRQVTRGNAWAGDPALSPDGMRVAYVSDAGGNLDIHVVAVSGGQPTRLTSEPSEDSDPAWLPDGSGLVFASNRSGACAVWKIGAGGGAPVMVMAGARDPAVSPDGRLLAFVRAAEDGMDRIHVAPLDDPSAIRRLTGADDGILNHGSPAWSPDGHRVCYATYHDLWLVSVRGGEPRALTEGGVADSSPAWSSDGRTVYFSSLRGNTVALWRVDVRSGRTERITPGSGPETDPSVAANGRALAYSTSAVQADEDVVVWDRDTDQRWLMPGLDQAYHPALAPDGRAVVYVSDRLDDSCELWLQPLVDGRPSGEPHHLTDQPGRAAYPCVSPDGRWIAYYRIVASDRQIWVVAADGSAPPVQITDHPGEDSQPAWSPDGGRLAFRSDRAGVPGVWAVAIDAGRRARRPVRLTPDDLPASIPAWAPDGERLAVIGNRRGRNEVWLVDADGSQDGHRIPLDVEPTFLCWPERSPGPWLCAAGQDTPGLKLLDPETGLLRDLGPPLEIDLYQFAADASGRLVTFSRPRMQGNIWVLAAEEEVF